MLVPSFRIVLLYKILTLVTLHSMTSVNSCLLFVWLTIESVDKIIYSRNIPYVYFAVRCPLYNLSY